MIIIKPHRNKQRKLSVGRKKVFSFLVVLLLLAILFFIVYKLLGQVRKKNEIDKEIGQLEKEIKHLNQENDELEGLVNYLETDSFKEREAKDKLNLIKEGEKLILVKENKSKDEEIKKEPKKPEVISRYSKPHWWWYYFFSIK